MDGLILLQVKKGPENSYSISKSFCALNSILPCLNLVTIKAVRYISNLYTEVLSTSLKTISTIWKREVFSVFSVYIKWNVGLERMGDF